jgi:O-antigen ligase
VGTVKRPKGSKSKENERLTNTFSEKCVLFSKRSAVFLSFVIPVSTVATHIVLFALMIAWFLSGHLQEKVSFILKHPVARVAFLLFGVFLIGATYSQAPIGDITELLSKMSKLLYLPFLLSLMTEEKWRRRAMSAFLSAMLFTLVLSFLKVYGGLPIATRHTIACIFKDHIYTNLMMAYASFVIGHSVLSDQTFWKRLGLLTILIGIIFYIFFMSEGRSGYVIFTLLWLLLGLQRYRFRGVLIGILGLILLVGLAHISSERFQRRVSTAIENLEQYWQGNSNSSVGARLEYSYNTLELFKQHPWLGWGTGSFKEAYQAYATKANLVTTQNPHNEYLNVLIQIGGLGLWAFLGFFWTILRQSFNLESPERWFVQGLWVSMTVGCFANSWLMDFTSGYFFMVLLACCFGALRLKNTPRLAIHVVQEKKWFDHSFKQTAPKTFPGD